MLVKIALFVTCLEKNYSPEHLCLRSFRLKMLKLMKRLYLSPENNSLQMAGLTHGPCNKWIINKWKKEIPPPFTWFLFSFSPYFFSSLCDWRYIDRCIRRNKKSTCPSLYKKITLDLILTSKDPSDHLICLGFLYLKYRNHQEFKKHHWLLHSLKKTRVQRLYGNFFGMIRSVF